MNRVPSLFSNESVCCRAGLGSGDSSPLVTPIVQSTTFCRDGVDSVAPHQYSRVGNPTVEALEDTLGTLENATRAVCFSTGLAAETALFLALLRGGDHVVCGRSVYGGTTRLLQRLLPDLGVEVTFVTTTDADDFAAAVRPGTKLVFIETPSNPTLEITDIRRVSEIAHSAGALLAVDNTFQTAVLQRPLDHGADISVYSTTKFIDGHSAALGGAVVSRNERVLERVRFIRKSTGAIQTPFNAWLTLLGIKTLALRLQRQSDTAAAIAAWLQGQPGVAGVYYPGLSGSVSQRETADRQHLGAHGGVVSFELVGGIDAARGFTRPLELCRLVEHVGSVETLLTHPATMTHADVPAEERRSVGLTDGLLRLSVGLEPAEDIIADLAQGFAVLRTETEAVGGAVCLATG